MNQLSDIRGRSPVSTPLDRSTTSSPEAALDPTDASGKGGGTGGGPGNGTPLMTPLQASVICAILTAAGPVSMNAMTPALPELARAMGISESRATLTFSVFLLGFSLSMLLAGPVSDRLGRRTTSIMFLSLYGAGSFWAMTAPSIGPLLAARLIQGIGVSSGLVISRALVRDQFTGRDATMVFSVAGVFNAVIPLMAPSIGAVSLLFGPWRIVFGVMVAYSVIALLLVIFAMKETLPPEKRTPLLLGATLKRYGEILRDARFMWPALALGLCVSGVYTMASGMSFILIDRLGLSTLVFGVVMVCQAGGFMVGSFISSRLMRIMPERRVVKLGMCSLCFGGAVLMLNPLAPTVPGYMVGIFCWVMGNGMCMPGLTSAALAHRQSFFGAASAVLGCFHVGIGFVAATLMGLLFRDTMLGVSVMLPILAVLAVTCFTLSGRTPRTE